MRGMKCFSLDDLIELLPYSLSIETYRTLNRIMEWNPNSITLPNRHWIDRLWNFIDEENKKMDDEAKAACLNKLMPWCLLPCKIKQSVEGRFMDIGMGRIGLYQNDKKYKYCLYPISFFEYVLNIETFRYNFADVLQDRLQLPTLDIENNFLQTKLPSFRKTRAVLKCLYLNRDNIQNRSSYISQVQSDTILEYISEYLSEQFSVDNDVIVWMKALPLHVTLTGHLVSLEDGQRILVLPEGMPTSGIGIWANQSRTTLLRKNEKLNKMHLLLRCVPSGIRDTYTRFVLASFNNLPRQFHIEHLEYVRDKLLAMSFSGKMHPEQIQLIQRLADVAFVPDIQNNLQQSCYFCSPFNHVMTEMLDASRFPCIEFCKKEWQKLLEWTGIEKEISVDMVIEFTKKIAVAGKSKISKDIIRKSNIVVEHILSQSDVITDGLLKQIAHTTFIVSHEIPAPLQNIFKPYKPKKLICLSGSVMCEHTDLCWSTCPILPDIFSIVWKHRNDLQMALGLLGPENKKVIQHIQNVIDDLHTKGNKEDISTEDMKTIEDLMEMFYRWMKENVSRDPQIVRCLRYKPVIFLPYQRRFVTCERVVRILDVDEFKQYLLPAPSRYGKYFDVFEKLGMKPRKSSYHYVKMSEYLYNEVGNNKLNENDLLVVKTTLDGLCKEIRNNNSFKEDLETVDKFYLPNRNIQLVNAKNVVVSDNEELEAYIENDNFSKQFFIGLKALEVYCDDSCWFLNQLPEKIRPNFLSQIIKEKMNENLDYQEHDNGRKLSNLMRMPEFAQGFVRIIVDYQSKDTNEKKLTVKDQGAIVKNIQRIRVSIVKTIHFDLFYQQEIVGSCQKSCFFDHKNCVLFCAISDEEPLESWLSDNSHIIHKALQKCTEHGYSWDEGHLLKILLQYENVNKISKMLDKLGILPYCMPYKDSVFPDPGISVPKELHCTLDNGFHKFEIGDYVALLICEASQDGDDSIYVYAKMDEIVKNKTDDSLFSISQLKYKVEVDVGRYEILPGYRLYKFTRKSSKSSELVPADTVPKRKVQSKDNELIYKETKDFIDRAWERPVQERKKLIKRLYMQYHPDRNIENDLQANDIFIYIRSIVNERETNPGVFKDEFNSWDYQIKKENTHRLFVAQPCYMPTFTNLIHNSGPSNVFAQNSASRSYNSAQIQVHNHVVQTVPSPQEARIWFKQSKGDISVASKVMLDEQQESAYNWICFLCYQATEKALKALHYSRDANNTAILRTSNLHNLVRCFDGELQTHVTQLTTLLGQQESMMYPSRSKYPMTPLDLYTKNMAEQALQLTTEIVEFVHKALYS